MKRNLFAAMVLFAFVVGLQAQTEKDPNKNYGLGFGAVPAIAYDSDLGFRYGALANLYWYGDGMPKPFYKHSFYVEWSHTTKGSDMKRVKYDSEYLIPGVRLTAEARLETEQAMDFYGFNGFEALFNPALMDKASADYISRMYYRMDRRFLRLKADFQGKIIDRKLRWYAGFTHYNQKFASVDIDRLNKGKDEADMLPDVNGLYDNYVEWGVIPEEQAEGGFNNVLKVGLVADTRDNEPNPNRGLWTEAFLITTPGFIGNKNPFTTFAMTHRQYFTIFPNKLTFAYRVNYQTTIGGNIPWYMLNFSFNTLETREGLGGSKSLRGVMRNRVVGEGYVLGNLELRWKFLKFKFIGSDWYLALSPFLDAARITKPYTFTEVPQMLQGDPDGWHLGYGAGLHIAWGENFIVAVDYGLAADKRDGDTGLYIGLDFLF